MLNYLYRKLFIIIKCFKLHSAKENEKIGKIKYTTIKIYINFLSSFLSKHISIGYRETCGIEQSVQHQSKLCDEINQWRFEVFIRKCFKCKFSCKRTLYLLKAKKPTYIKTSYFQFICVFELVKCSVNA